MVLSIIFRDVYIIKMVILEANYKLKKGKRFGKFPKLKSGVEIYVAIINFSLNVGIFFSFIFDLWL